METAAEDAAEGILTGPATVQDKVEACGGRWGWCSECILYPHNGAMARRAAGNFFWRDRPASQPYGARATMRGYLTRATQNSALHECGSEAPQGCWRLLAVTQDRSVLGSVGAGPGRHGAFFSRAAGGHKNVAPLFGRVQGFVHGSSIAHNQPRERALAQEQPRAAERLAVALDKQQERPLSRARGPRRSASRPRQLVDAPASLQDDAAPIPFAAAL